MRTMPDSDRDPLAATVRLLVDGTNLLHTMSRRPGAAPAAALVGRLRGAIPAFIAIELVFDGPAEPGLRGERIASGVSVRYSGGRTADVVILNMVDAVRKAGDADDTAALLVVTDDRELRYEVRLRGARTAGAKWLLGRLDTGRLSSPSVGNPRPAKAAKPAPKDAVDEPGDDARAGWKPGRGATTKKGNSRKAPRSGGTGRMPP
jgi:hypothetical protein